MKSLVLEFENMINDKQYSTADLLRHCLIIARKLKQKEFVEWINNELNGYENKEIPFYRKIPLSIKFYNSYYGWRPFVITDDDLSETLNHMPIRLSISELESTINNNENDLVIFSVPASAKRAFMVSIPFDTDFCYEGNINSLVKINETVKTKMLNWIMDLEENDIVDENLSFNENQIKKSNKVTKIVINNIYGTKNKMEIRQSID